MSDALVISLTVVVDDPGKVDHIVNLLTGVAGSLAAHGEAVSLSLTPTSDDDEEPKV